MRTRVMGSLLLAAALLVSACAKPQETPKEEYKGTLTIWAAASLAGYTGPPEPKGGWSKFIEERAGAYKALHEGTEVVIKLFDNPSDLERSVTAPVAAELPDLVFGRFLPELAPRLADITVDRDDYLPGALAAFTGKQSQLHGVPALLELQVLALNEQAFTAAGVPLPKDGRWSQSEFEASLKSLSGSGKSGLGFYQLPGYHEWYPLAGGVFARTGSLETNLEAGIGRLASYRQEGWLHPDTGKAPAAEIWRLFTADPPAIGIMPVGTWALPNLRSEPYNVKLSVAAFPGDVTVGYTYGFSVFRQEDAERLKAAVDLAEFIAAPDQQVRLARQLLLMPARKSAGNPFEGDALLTRAYALAPLQRALPAGPLWDQQEERIAEELRFAVLGARSPKAAVDRLRGHLSSAIAPVN